VFQGQCSSNGLTFRGNAGTIAFRKTKQHAGKDLIIDIKWIKVNYCVEQLVSNAGTIGFITWNN
jgi:hypothetical protein